ncbi:MAG TPA: hypothetical protein DFS52_07955 [Myxococcales bacterium]|jgi:hypothetical protein|nr:hypothetical protein [Myxococcales bacterium]
MKTRSGDAGWTPQTSEDPNLHLLDDDDSQASSAVRALFRLRPRRSAKSWRARYEALSPDLRRVVDLFLAAEDARLLLEQLGFSRMDGGESGARTYRELVRSLQAFLGPIGGAGND